MAGVATATMALSVVTNLVFYRSAALGFLLQRLVFVALTGVLLFFLYRGWTWARWITIAFCAIAATQWLLAGTLLLATPPAGVILLGIAAVYAGCALLLLPAPVRAFFRGQQKESEARAAGYASAWEARKPRTYRIATLTGAFLALWWLHSTLTGRLWLIFTFNQNDAADIWGEGTPIYHIIFFPLYAHGPATSLSDILANSAAFALLCVLLGTGWRAARRRLTRPRS